MKPILSFLVLVLSLGVATSAFATDSYVCIGSKITRFIFDKNTKECRSITEESYNIYIVERHKNANHQWGVRKPGESVISYICDEDFNESGYLLYDSIGNFRIYRHNLKFLSSYHAGYCYTADDDWQVTNETGRFVPYVEIGRCHPL